MTGSAKLCEGAQIDRGIVQLLRSWFRIVVMLFNNRVSFTYLIRAKINACTINLELLLPMESRAEQSSSGLYIPGESRQIREGMF